MFGSLQDLVTISADDIVSEIGVVCIYAVFRYLLCHKVLQKISDVVKPKSSVKFIHRSFDLIHYSTSALMGLISLVTRPYGHCVVWAQNCAADLEQKEVFECTGLEKLYYMVFTAYYVVDLFYLWTNTSDYRVLVLHHAVTLFMIFSAIVLKTPVLGLDIMLLHDVVDVPLYTGKILSYIGCGRSKDVAFLLFTALCIHFRIINFPVIIYHAIKNGQSSVKYPLLYHTTCGALVILYGCHLYWLSKILECALSLLHGGKIRDNRSD